MKNKYCMGCGAPLYPDTVVCPNCGRLVTQNSPPQNTHQRTKERGRGLRKSNTARRAYREEPVYAEPVAQSSAEPRKRKRISGAIFRLLTVAFVVIAVYIAVFAVQVFRVKMSSYDFGTELTLSAENYGQAIDGYFNSGKWSVNPFNGTCTYRGETKHNEEYEIVFSAKIKVNVEKITVDGEAVEEKQIKTRLMGMFI
jgi:hypothetical protein